MASPHLTDMFSYLYHRLHRPFQTSFKTHGAITASTTRDAAQGFILGNRHTKFTPVARIEQLF